MEFLDYGNYVTVAHSPEPLYRKRRWVPQWLWRWVAGPDYWSHLATARHESQQRYEKELERSIMEDGHS
jgi:hypothetical protein